FLMVRLAPSLARFAIIYVAAALCTACGTSYTPIASNLNGSAQAQSSGGNVNNLFGGSSGSTGGSSSTSGTTTTGGQGGTASPITERVGAVGYTSTSITISAASVLKMIFTPGIQDQTVAGTGVSPQYSYLGVYITVNGVTQNT